MNVISRHLLNLTLAAAVATTAHASSIIINTDTDQSANGSLGTVDLDSGDPLDPVIYGTTKSGQKLRFTATEALIVVGNHITTVGGGGFSSVDIRFVDGRLFDRIVFNVKPSTPGSITISAYDQSSTKLGGDMLSLSSTGSNFINVEAIASQHIYRVNVTTSNLQITEMAQVRVGGVEQSAIPEPGSMMLLSIGAAAIGAAKSLAVRRAATLTKCTAPNTSVEQ
jgi:hypothetical protein